MLLKGDCRQQLATLPDNSVHAIITDPPYGLEFMGKEWDAPWKGKAAREFNQLEPGTLGGFTQLPNHSRVNNTKCQLCDRWKFSSNPCKCEKPQFPNARLAAMEQFQKWFIEVATECLRVLKPGGHLLAFGGSRTYHRLACAIEDAGFEIRDQIMWVYGSGFPKSLNVGKQEGCESWQGWGTALKPAHEPIVLARKPLDGTVANNVLTHGVGALNINACRVGSDGATTRSTQAPYSESGWRTGHDVVKLDAGRWPANFIHDGSNEVLQLFPDSKGGAYPAKRGQAVNTAFASGQETEGGFRKMGDDGSAARFFYCAKASRTERNTGLDHLPADKPVFGDDGGTYQGLSNSKHPQSNFHPTVKPLALIHYLIKLVTPPGGTILDPFLGSGTTAVAAVQLGHPWIGCELTEDYWPIIEARVAHAEPLT